MHANLIKHHATTIFIQIQYGRYNSYRVRFGVDADAVGEEEVGARRVGDGRLDAADGLGHGAELEGADAGGGEQRREDHVVPRGHAHDVVHARVDPLHQPAPRPPRPQHHHPSLLLPRQCGAHPWKGWRRRALAGEAASMGERD